MIILRNNSYGGIIRVCMGIFTTALRNKKIRQILNKNTSPYFHDVSLAIWPLTLMKRAHFKKSPFLMYVENLEMKNSLKWAVQGDRSRCDQNGDTMVTQNSRTKIYLSNRRSWSPPYQRALFIQQIYYFFSPHHIPTNSVAPFSANKATQNPQFL